MIRDESRDDGATTMAAPSASSWPAVADERGQVSVRAMGVASATAFGIVLLVFTQSLRFQVWDERARYCTGASGRAWALIVDPLVSITVGTLGLALCCFVAVALVRRRIGLAVAAIIVVAGPNITTQLLKAHWSTHPHLWDNSLPSGHSTAAMSTALAAVLVSPSRWRPHVLVVGSFGATFVGAGTIVGHWHRPADVIAAFLCCLAWSALAIGLVLKFQLRRRTRDARYSIRPGRAVAAASCVGLVFILLGVRPVHHQVKWIEAGITFTSIGLLSALVVSWVAAAAEDNLG